MHPEIFILTENQKTEILFLSEYFELYLVSHLGLQEKPAVQLMFPEKIMGIQGADMAQCFYFPNRFLASFTSKERQSERVQICWFVISTRQLYFKGSKLGLYYPLSYDTL